MKESELRLLDRITDAFVALDDEWRFVFVNRLAAELLGRERLDLLGKGIWTQFPALVGEPFHAACLRAMESQISTRVERFSARLGRWIENRVYPSPEGLTILFTDITERKEREASLRQYQDIFRLAEVGLVIGTGDGATLERMNPAFARMHGYEAEELRGRPVEAVYAPEVRAELPSLLSRTEEMGHHVYESLHLHRDGTTFPVSVDTTAVRDEEGRVLYRIVNVTDITERRQAETALHEAVLRLEALIGNLQAGLLVADSQGQIVLTNQALCDMMGLSIPPGALIGAGMSIFTQHVRHLFVAPEPLLARLADIHGGRKSSQGEEIPLIDGRVFEMDYSPVFPEGGVGCHLWQWRDVTDRHGIEREIREASAVLQAQKRELEAQKRELEAQKRELEEANARLEALATTDGLTGLLNQRVFGERLSEEFLRTRRYEEPLALIVIDVDRFKDYNDAFGHLAGNSVLKGLAAVLREHARETDLAARFGGEEFALILPHTGIGEAVALAERLRVAVQDKDWDARRNVTASLGVSALTPQMDGPDALVASADAAMYRAKAGGRNRVAAMESTDTRS